MVGEKLSRGDVPQSVVQMVRQGRITALVKLDGSVKTMAQQLGDVVEGFRAPYQYALRTEAGCECSSVHPFVRLFDRSPSEYFWEDATGTVHTIHHGEGSEQGDPFMPLLFSVG